MATTVGQHSVATFSSPVNGATPIDANTVRGNDNTIRSGYNDHDSDTGIHVQSSTLASQPAAGTAGRKWITTGSTSTENYRLWYDDGTRWHEVSNSKIDVLVKADVTLAAGDVVKITGYNAGSSAPTVNKVSSASDAAFGVVVEAIASGSTGYITNTGLVFDLVTNSFSVGDTLYTNSSGGFTATKPTSGTYQASAYVLRSHSSQGVLFVEFAEPHIVERSDNTASTIVLRDGSGAFTTGAITSEGLITFASLKGTGSTTVTNIFDEDNMASNSATALATQQSIKAYVDSQVGTVDTLAEILANGNTSGGTNLIMSAGDTLTADTIAETTAGSGVTIDSVLLKDDVVNATDIEVGTISANDGVQSAVVASATGVMTIASSVLTTTDINGGTVDGAVIGGASAAAGTFTTLTANTNLTIAGTTTVDGVIDDDTMATASATKLATSESIKAYVDTQITAEDLDFAGDSGSGSVDLDSQTFTIAGTSNEVETSGSGQTLTVGLPSNVTIGNNLTVTNDLDVDGTTNLDAVDIDGAVQIDSTVTVGVDDTGYDVKFFGATPGAYMLWDESADDLVLAGAAGLDVAGDIDVDGTTNLDVVDIDGAVDMASTLTVAGDVTVDTSTLKVDTSNNRVGIGTASPTEKLDVRGSAVFSSSGFVGVTVDQTDSGKAALGVSSASAEAFINSTGNGAYAGLGEIKFLIEAAEKVRIDNDGNVGINTASPLAGLDVRSKSIVAGNTSSAGGQTIIQGYYSATSDFLVTLGSMYSNAFALIGYAVKSSPSTAGTFVSTADNAAFKRGALEVGSELRYSSAGLSTTTVGNTIALTRRFTIDEDGNVGIGTASPLAQLHVQDTTAAEIRVAGTNSSAKLALIAPVPSIELTDTSGGATDTVIQQNSSKLTIYNNGAGIALDSAGKVGIGTTSPSEQLDVVGDVEANSYVFNSNIAVPTTAAATLFNQGSVGPTLSGLNFEVRTGTSPTPSMRVNQNGRVGIGTTNPGKTLDVVGNFRVSTDAVFNSYIDVTGFIYHRSNVGVLNKAQNGWITWATRNTAGSESVIDLSNIGSVNATQFVGGGAGLTGVLADSSTVTDLGANTNTYYPIMADGTSGSVSHFVESSDLFWRNGDKRLEALNLKVLNDLTMASNGDILMGTSGEIRMGASGTITSNTTQTRDKIRVWNSPTYTIGMKNGYTFGPLSGYATSFQMNNTAGRGWWWGIDTHTDAQGAMALNNAGELTVADSIRVGYGTSDTTAHGTAKLDVNGSVSINATGGISDATLHVEQPGSTDIAFFASASSQVNSWIGFTGGSSYENYFTHLSGTGKTVFRHQNNAGGGYTEVGRFTDTGLTIPSSCKITHNTNSTRDKYRLYSSSTYAIGMQSGVTFGALNDWAMTFQFNNDDDRGFWWGDDGHSTAQGAMSLSTAGNLTVADSIRVGYGTSDVAAHGTAKLDVSGFVRLNAGNNSATLGDPVGTAGYLLLNNSSGAVNANTGVLMEGGQGGDYMVIQTAYQANNSGYMRFGQLNSGDASIVETLRINRTNVLAASGGVANPGYGFLSDPDTGIWLNGAGVLSFAVRGTTRFQLDEVGTTTGRYSFDRGQVYNNEGNRITATGNQTLNWDAYNQVDITNVGGRTINIDSGSMIDGGHYCLIVDYSSGSTTDWGWTSTGGTLRWQNGQEPIFSNATVGDQTLITFVKSNGGVLGFWATATV